MLEVLRVLLVLVEVVCCCLLIAAILIQKSKTHGAGLAFGSSMGESLFGGQASTVLTKTTVVLAIIFLANTAILTLLTTRKLHGYIGSVPAKGQPAQQAPGPQGPAGGMPAAPAGPESLPAVPGNVPAASTMPSLPDSSVPAIPAPSAPVVPPPSANTPDSSQKPAP